MMYEFVRDGLFHFVNACSDRQLRAIDAALDGVKQHEAGVRLYRIPSLGAPLDAEGCVGQFAARLIGAGAFPVRAILFDKGVAKNWALGWHQDRTVVVKMRADVHGFDAWSVKAGLQHVAPPIEILNKMVTLRLHLDPVSKDNAPLEVAIGSHRLGRIAESDINDVVGNSQIATCLAQRGDLWAYSTPILHASAASLWPNRRRVLQVDYAACDLPGGLEWLGIT
ncbi:MAG: phytanoyl-CoA dioxygenase family protein [Sphingorhabdus sp.]